MENGCCTASVPRAAAGRLAPQVATQNAYRHLIFPRTFEFEERLEQCKALGLEDAAGGEF